MGNMFESMMMPEPIGEGKKIDAVCELIDIINTHAHKGTAPKTGAIGKFTYTLDLPDKRNKHAFVRYVSLQQNGKIIFQCVIRDQQDTLKTLGGIQAKSIHYLPKLYRAYGDWAILEKITGIEQEEIQKKLEMDLQFRALYAQETCSLLQATAADKLLLDDVSFVLGNNVKVDPKSANIRLIEQDSLEVSVVRQPNELIAAQLFNELETVSRRPTIVTPKQPDENLFDNNKLGNLRASRVDFVYQLVELLCQSINPADLYVRPAKIKPTHRKYIGTLMGGYNYEDAKIIHEMALANNDETSLLFQGNPNTKLLSQRLVDAVNNQDMQTFHSLLLNGEHTTDITDPSDPRTSYVVLPDEN